MSASSGKRPERNRAGAVPGTAAKEMALGDDTELVVSRALTERAQGILEALKAAHLSIVTAESCTAGMVAAILSRVDGAGELLHGGFITYTKEQKTKALGVSAQ